MTNISLTTHIHTQLPNRNHFHNRTEAIAFSYCNLLAAFFLRYTPATDKTGLFFPMKKFRRVKSHWNNRVSIGKRPSETTKWKYKINWNIVQEENEKALTVSLMFLCLFPMRASNEKVGGGGWERQRGREIQRERGRESNRERKRDEAREVSERASKRERIIVWKCALFLCVSRRCTRLIQWLSKKNCFFFVFCLFCEYSFVWKPVDFFSIYKSIIIRTIIVLPYPCLSSLNRLLNARKQ